MTIDPEKLVIVSKEYQYMMKNILKIASCILATLTISVAFSYAVNADVPINVTGGAAAATDTRIEVETNQDSTIPSIVTDEIPKGTINKGVYADSVDLSSKSYTEAKAAIEKYVESLKSVQITLVSINGETRIVTAGELGLSWSNQEILDEAIGLGKDGNIIKRYKELKDLEHSNKIYPIIIDVEDEKVSAIVEQEASAVDIEPVDATITKDETGFHVVNGQTGYRVNENLSTLAVKKAIEEDWDKQNKTIDLVVDVVQPKGKEDELVMVKDLLGTYTTNFKSSGNSRSGNVRNGVRLINGTVLYPGEEFSAYDAVNPFTEENGYYMAGSYLNGLVVESLGGGICQVTSTLYNAVLRSELEVTERFNHSMIVTYVNLSSDAAISGTSKNFRFVNNQKYPIYIEGYTSEDKKITFNVYGVETRAKNREVVFESVEVSRTEPEGERVIADPSQPVGFIDVQSAHTGFVGELWKVVKVDGVETERTKINKSVYTMAPRTATVGTAAADPNISATMQAAAATNSIEYCKGMIASLNAAAAAAMAGTGDVPVE